jgi:hypothetical protein
VEDGKGEEVNREEWEEREKYLEWSIGKWLIEQTFFQQQQDRHMVVQWDKLSREIRD